MDRILREQLDRPGLDGRRKPEDKDIDWYALSNGLDTIMSDGTRVPGSNDD